MGCGGFHLTSREDRTDIYKAEVAA